MCGQHHSHRSEPNCYLCRAILAEHTQTSQDEADE